MLAESNLRTITRGITYRLLAVLITALWTGLGEAIAIHLVLTLLYYVHERLWLRIKWLR